MKTTVWTSYQQLVGGKRKCVFRGDMKVMPSPQVGLVVREGFCVESISHIFYDLIKDSIEIHLMTTDPDNIYGLSLE